MARKDEHYQVYHNDRIVAEATTMENAMRFATKYQQWGGISVIRDSCTGKRFTAYGLELIKEKA